MHIIHTLISVTEVLVACDTSLIYEHVYFVIRNCSYVAKYNIQKTNWRTHLSYHVHTLCFNKESYQLSNRITTRNTVYKKELNFYPSQAK